MRWLTIRAGSASVALFFGALGLACASTEEEGVQVLLGDATGSTADVTTDARSDTRADAKPSGETSAPVAAPDLGKPCKQNTDCSAELCIQLASKSVCSQGCSTACPAGWYCRVIANGGGADSIFACIPEDTPDACGNQKCDPGETPTSCPADCATKPEPCGNGTCDVGETPASCPTDCKDGPNACGNQKCDLGETPMSCPSDCKPPTPATCITDHCKTDVCAANAACQGGIDCLASCKDAACVDKCIAATPQQVHILLSGIASCANQAGCFKIGPPPETCGNGACDPGETNASCPKDCPPAPPGSCAGKCGQYQEGASCQCDQECTQFGDCCGDYATLCSGQNQCGNGQCNQGENPFNCPQDCQPPNQCGNGQCNQGETVQSCPQDCKPPESCGNGTCNEGESYSNCPKDCPLSATAQCLADHCQIGQCLSVAPCAAVITCMGKCTTDACAMTCIGQVPPQVGGFLQGVVTCGANAKCFTAGPPPVGCGNGNCGEGETPATCPADCKEPTSVLTCLKEKCPVGLCPTFPGCNGALECLAACTTGQCREDCIDDGPDASQNLLEEVSQCGVEKACFPAAPPPTGCGNGNCNQNENGQTCPQDCAADPLACIKDKCPIPNCANLTGCETGLACVAKCKNWDCVQNCTDNLPNSTENALEFAGGCGFQNNCM